VLPALAPAGAGTSPVRTAPPGAVHLARALGGASTLYMPPSPGGGALVSSTAETCLG
jgi:hypothetical protein